MDKDKNTASFEDRWNDVFTNALQPFLKSIANEDIQRSDQYNNIASLVSAMCSEAELPQLYQKYCKTLIQYFDDYFVSPLQSAKEKQESSEFLIEWIRRWKHARLAIDGMATMFNHLDSAYVCNNPESTLTTTKQGYTIFKRYIFDAYKQTVRESMLHCIHKNRDMIRDAFVVCVELTQTLNKNKELQMDRNDFEKAIEYQTRKYYRQKSKEWLRQLSYPNYLIKAEKCLDEERNRFKEFLDESSLNRLLQPIRNELLELSKKELFNKESGINDMLQIGVDNRSHKNREHLSRLYQLYSYDSNAIETISDGIVACFTQRWDGVKSIDKYKRIMILSHWLRIHIVGMPTDLIQLCAQFGTGFDCNRGTDLIHLLYRLKEINENSFRSDQRCHNALTALQKTFMTEDRHSSAYVARYTHAFLKKGTKIYHRDLEDGMDHIVVLYQYMPDKDRFEADYQSLLAQRLLNNVCMSEKAEHLLITKFKAGFSNMRWIARMETMFSDIKKSKQVNLDFGNTHGSEFDMELNVSICQSGVWSTLNYSRMDLIPEIKNIADRFRQFWAESHSYRRLHFVMDKGSAEVRVQFNAKTRKILVVSTYQMLILCQFTDKKTLTLKEIQNATNIPRLDLEMHLISMVHPKVRVLRKNPNNPMCGDGDKIQINPKYSNPRAKVWIPVMDRNKIYNTDSETQSKSIALQRRQQTDAAIIRIVAMRQTFGHSDLVSEVMQQLKHRFRAKRSDINLRIADLVERSYLKRDENDQYTRI